MESRKDIMALTTFVLFLLYFLIVFSCPEKSRLAMADVQLAKNLFHTVIGADSMGAMGGNRPRGRKKTVVERLQRLGHFMR